MPFEKFVISSIKLRAERMRHPARFEGRQSSHNGIVRTRNRIVRHARAIVPHHVYAQPMIVWRKPMAGCLGAFLVAGCASVPTGDIDSASMLAAVPDRLPSQPPSIAGTANLTQWWLQMQDPALNTLIETMLVQNPDLEAARLRYVRANALITAERGQLLPRLDTSGSVNRSIGNEDPGGDTTRFNNLMSASWEIDLFGGLRSSVAAARSDAQASAADYGAQRVSLIAGIAVAYVDEKLARRRIALTESTLVAQKRTAQIAEWRVDAGLATGVDREQARQLVFQTEASLPGLRSSRRVAANRVAALAGAAPGEVDRMLDGTATMPAPVAVTSIIPADLVRRRPDVAVAENDFAAETARIGIARANLYPRLTLGGSIGSNALSIGDLVDSLVGSLEALMTQTLFDGGRNRANLRAQEAQAKVALAQYRSTVLAALEEADNAYDAARAAGQRLELRHKAERTADNAALYIRQQYSAGLVDFSRLLDAERTLLSARDARAQAEADVVQSSIRLVQALGGDSPPANAFLPGRAQ
jgi:outer membrane protein, multidrug efflux system